MGKEKTDIYGDNNKKKTRKCCKNKSKSCGKANKNMFFSCHVNKPYAKQKHMYKMAYAKNITHCKKHPDSKGIKYFTKKRKTTFLKGLFFGALIGGINGFWGGGGGMVCVPVLCNLFKLEEKHAHATAIFIMFPISLVSFVVYYLNGFFNMQKTGLVTIFFTLGGLLGAIILKKVNNQFLRIIFGVLIIVAGVRMLF